MAHGHELGLKQQIGSNMDRIINTRFNEGLVWWKHFYIESCVAKQQHS